MFDHFYVHFLYIIASIKVIQVFMFPVRKAVSD